MSKTSAVPEAPDAAVVRRSAKVERSAIRRDALIRWLGNPPGGEPRLTVGSHSLGPSPSLNVDLDVPHPLATSPGELLAGAIGAIFAKLIADELVAQGTQAHELVVELALTLSSEGESRPEVVLTGIACQLEARIPGGREDLQHIAEASMAACLENLAMRTELLDVSVTTALLGVQRELGARSERAR